MQMSEKCAYPPDGGVYPDQPPPPPQQQYPGYPPQTNPDYDPMKQPGLVVGPNPPPYQPAAYPPAVQYPQPITQQQTSNNVVVVSTQPTVASTTVVVTRNDKSTFIFALIVTFILVFCGCWWSLFCTIPAMVLANMASTAGGRGDMETKSKYDKISMLLTVGAIVFQVVGFIVLIGTIAGVVSSSARVVTSSRCSSPYYCG